MTNGRLFDLPVVAAGLKVYVDGAAIFMGQVRPGLHRLLSVKFDWEASFGSMGWIPSCCQRPRPDRGGEGIQALARGL